MRSSILLVEEDEIIRKSLRDWLETVLFDCRVLEAGGSDEAVALARTRSPHVILVDVTPPSAAGLEIVRDISDAAPDATVIALAMEDDRSFREKVSSAGASECVRIWEIRTELLPKLRTLLDEEEREPGGKIRVVYIEDEPDMVNLIKLALERSGFELIGALGGRQGLKIIRRTKPDLVLLDLMMPDVDGWEVYQRMKGDDRMRDIPIVVVTVVEPSNSRVQDLQVQDYVTKPFRPKELVRRVNEVLLASGLARAREIDR